MPSRARHSEVTVDLPALVAIASLPARLDAAGLTVELAGAAGAAGVVGDLRAHIAAATWRRGRHHGTASYEVVRTHDDRCAVTVVLDGDPRVDVHAVADALRAHLQRRRSTADDRGTRAPESPAEIRSA